MTLGVSGAGGLFCIDVVQTLSRLALNIDVCIWNYDTFACLPFIPHLPTLIRQLLIPSLYTTRL